MNDEKMLNFVSVKKPIGDKKEKLILLFFILVISPVFAFNISEIEMTGNYTIMIEENGDALVTLDVNGSGTMNLPLPLDVVSPSVDHALYIQTPNGIDISVGSARRALVTYHTSLLTTKQVGIWNLEMELPKFDFASVSMTLPKNVEIIQTSPQAWITHTANSTNLLWDLNPVDNDTITLQYRFVQYALAQIPSPTPTINETISPPKNKSVNLTKPIFEEKTELFSQENFLLFVILVSTLSVSLYFYYVKRKNKRSYKLTKGVANVIKTLSENEYTIVNMLLQNSGEMKRNKLEKTSGLAKSSLASSLYRLEQRNIVEIDKSGAIHYVRLTDWFKSL